jgi:rhodanese-related sulfurtransferase
VTTIAPHDLDRLRAGGRPIDLIDVRSPGEYGEVHVPFARNVPLGDLDPVTIAANRIAPTGDPIYVICKSGGRGQKACAILPNAVNVDGGTAAWVDAGLPVVRGRKAMSLERQVRIVAGALVLVGIGLAYFVHPTLIGISAFVGGGLVFAGLTDTCGMGLMLARMPWNRSKATCAVPAAGAVR